MAIAVVGLLFVAAPAAWGLPVEETQCVGDADGDGRVTADEVVQTVDNGLHGCGLVPVELRFRGQVGDRPFACGEVYDDVGASRSRWLPADLRFYVHDVRLVRADGSEVRVALEQNPWQSRDLALLDFENREPPCNSGTVQTNAVVRGAVAAGEYVGVRFTLGVPFDRNHSEDCSSAPSPLSLCAMHWGWQGGYKFLRVDSFALVGESDFEEFRIHLGSTGCRYGREREVAGCVWPNRADVLLEDFDAARDVIVADLAAVLADSNLLTNVAGTAPGCMSDRGDTDCEPVFARFGIEFDDGYPTPLTQAFFRVEPANP